MGSWAAVRGRRPARTTPLLAALLAALFVASPHRADAGLATADLARAEQRLSRAFHENGLSYPPRAVTLIALKNERFHQGKRVLAEFDFDRNSRCSRCLWLHGISPSLPVRLCRMPIL